MFQKIRPYLPSKKILLLLLGCIVIIAIILLIINRDKVENFFAKLKQYRAIATRYDKTAHNFLGAIYLVSDRKPLFLSKDQFQV